MERYHEIIINSKDRFVGTPTNFKVQLPTQLTFYKARVQSVCIPYSWYEFKNQVLTLVYGSTTTTINIPDGTYSSTQLLAILNSGVYNSDTTNLEFFFSETEGKFEFRLGLNQTVTLTCTQGLEKLMGWTSGTVIPPALGQVIYVAPKCADLTTDYLVVTSNELAAKFKAFSYTASNKLNNSILSKINVEKGFGELISLIKDLDASTFFTNAGGKDESNISTMDIQLRDSDLNIIDLNGLNWSLRIGFYSQETF